MKRFLRELETCLASLNEVDRAELIAAYQALIRGVMQSTTAIGGHFRPSTFATVQLITAIASAVSPSGAKAFFKTLQTDATNTGPHVATLVRFI